MNYRVIGYVIGKILIIEAAMLLLPAFICIGYGEPFLKEFGIPILLLLLCGLPLGVQEPSDMKMYAKEGYVIVALSWILVSLFGALPLFFSGYVPNYLDCVFEAVSGFTTTGATILDDIEALTHGLLFWRSFTHWVGGMGVLVFLLAVIPATSSSSFMHLMRAEVAGPTVGKISSKIRDTARTLYIIYFAMTLVEIVLLIGGGMPVFDAFIHSFGTAGTGGFSNHSASVGFYHNAYFEIVISVFMILFSFNFNLFYLIILGKLKDVLKSEELRVFLILVVVSTFGIAFNIRSMYGSFGESLRTSLFQVASIMSTTGYATANFDLWPTFSKIILLAIMFIGGCAGSTAGGLKMSRIVIMFKTTRREVSRMIHPHSVQTVRFEGRPVEELTARSINLYVAVYIFIYVASMLLLAFEKKDFMTLFSAVSACLNNVGPGFGEVGAVCSYSGLTPLTKVTLTFDMLFGRLELFPMLVLFTPSIWTKNRSKIQA
ncbi:MAG: TrkH family potassium uptake protein [Clostridia bacterium]|nr:TrkH family potassium uptake protein [Clostridia bacterium]